MTRARDVVFLSAVRTAIGDYGGSLKDIPPTQLAASVVRESVRRARIEPADIGHCVFGNVIHTEPRDMYLSRVACVEGGLPVATPALTLNRLCGSGLQAIVSAAQAIALGDTDAAVAGGAESMSRAAYMNVQQRWGARMGDAPQLDAMVGALTDPFDGIHMGVTAENVAARCAISREQQDAFAVESHRRAVEAATAGRFTEQILPIELKTRKGTTSFAADEHVRADVTLESLARLRAAFAKDGSVTAGNASGLNDAAAAVVLMEGAAAEARDLRPMARLVAYAHSGIDPKIMGLGPVAAVRRVLEKSGLRLDEIELVESNEAFAAQALGVAQELELDPARVNPNGGAIALGHPIGATGCILVVKAIHELHRTGARYALVTMCIGGGQGIAAVVERL